MKRARLAAIVGSLSCLLTAGALLVAGPLDPPAAVVAPTFKTLSEIEPRTAVDLMNTPGDADSVFRITQPGSYYLTGDMQGVGSKSGIEIAAGHVTIDLMGYTLRGAPGSHSGIRVVGTNISTISVKNGIVTAWGREGVDLGSATEDGGSLIDGIIAVANLRVGIQAPDHSIIRNSRASENTQAGFILGSRSLVQGCVSHSNGSIGISVGFGSIVRDCTVTRNVGDGVNTGAFCQVVECSAIENEADGIDVASGCTVSRNLCESNGLFSADGAGVHVTGGDCRIEDNAVNRNDRGIDVDVAGNFVVRNSASGNTTNFDVTGTQTIGPIVTATGTIAGASPWANFSF